MTAELRLFGGAALLGDDGQLVAGSAAQPRRLAVLAVLADAWPTPVTRDRLVGLIWPESDDAGARRLLTQALYALRRELGDFTNVSGRDVAIDAEALRVDLIEFRRAIAAGDLDRAVALHRGPVLDGFHLRGAVEFERWTDTLRDATERHLREALEGMIRRHVADGQPREAARWAERLVQAAPFDVGAVLQHMELLERAGDVNAAIWAAAGYTRRIREELEVEPAPAISARAEQLRARATADAETAAARRLAALEKPPSAVGPRPSTGAQRAASSAAPWSPDEQVMAAPRQSADAPLEPPLDAAPVIAAGGRAPRAENRHRWFLPLGIVAAAIAAIVVATRASTRSVMAMSAPPLVTVLPFVLRGDTALARRAASVTSTVMISALDGSGGTVVREAGAAGPAGAAGTLGGTISVIGGELQLETELRADGQPAVKATVAGPRDSLIALARRASLQLVPALYPRLAGAVPDEAVRRFTAAAPLRAFLDGEEAFRRGAFVAAYEAYRRSTELDSTQAWAWYRRALAAEEAHRNPEADRSLAQARARAASLGERERRLLDGFALWRAGRSREADAALRALVAGQAPDRDAWLHFAEIAYHAGPLLGRPVDDALDPWRRVAALDPGSVPALVHLVRLEARAGDSVAAAALVRRLTSEGADGVEAAESRVVAAYGTGNARRIAGVGPLLDTLPDYSLHFLHATVAGLLERPAEARAIAERLTRPSRPVAMRAEGHIALAHLAMAGGQWRRAWAELDSAAPLNPAAAAWTRAYFAALPFVQLPDSVVADADRRLAGASAMPTAAPLYLQLAVEGPAGPAIEQYLEALLRQSGGVRRLGDEPNRVVPIPGRERACGDGASAATRSLCADLRLGAEAEEARLTGQPSRALASLEALEMTVPYQFAGRSVFFARTRERWLRAELLAAAGREGEALQWYASVALPSRYDYLYLAPSHLRRAQILERQGNRSSAAAHYRKVLDVWRAPDAELAGVRREAEDGLRRLGR